MEKLQRLKNVGFHTDRRALNHPTAPLGMQPHVISSAITLSIGSYWPLLHSNELHMLAKLPPLSCTCRQIYSISDDFSLEGVISINIFFSHIHPGHAIYHLHILKALITDGPCFQKKNLASWLGERWGILARLKQKENLSYSRTFNLLSEDHRTESKNSELNTWAFWEMLAVKTCL